MDTINATMSEPGVAAELLGKAAYYLAEAQPFIPMYTHLIISALFPIYTGAHASLSRPSSAAKPPKKDKKKHGEDSEDDDETLKMEGMSPKDAIIFPLLAGSTLAGLYFLIKWAGADMLNLILGWYFSGIGVFSVGKLISDGLSVVHSFVWPTYYSDRGHLWKMDGKKRKAVSAKVQHDGQMRSSPLPGILSRIPLPSRMNDVLWSMREVPKQKYTVDAYIHHILKLKTFTNLLTVFSWTLGFAAISYANFVHQTWWLTNLQGFAVSYSALQLLSPTDFATGSLILSALFFYDIYFVFFTPMMVTVAKNLDVPIKLMFPRPEEPSTTPGESPKQSFGMLGLGDIVLPGIVIGLALRFDLYMFYLRKQKQVTDAETDKIETEKANFTSPTGRWGDSFWTGRKLTLSSPLIAAAKFPKVYFTATITGYIIGMMATLGVMTVYQHAQPALLYLVPGVLTALWSTALVRGEIKEMWNFSEAEEDEQGDTKKDEKQVDDAKEGDSTMAWWQKLYESMGSSFFGSEKREKNAQKLEKSLNKSMGVDTDASAGKDDGDKDRNTASEAEKGTKSDRDLLFSFSVHRHSVVDDSKPSVAQKEEPETEDAGSTASPSPSDSSANDTVIVSSNDLDGSPDSKPVWRGSGSDKDRQKAEKRMRVQ